MGPFNIDMVLEDYGAEQEPIIDRTYSTHWLGEGRYRLFKFSHDES
jgi:hypothetical protein